MFCPSSLDVKELTPEAGHAEVFGEPQRVEWLLTQRRSLQEPGGVFPGVLAHVSWREIGTPEWFCQELQLIALDMEEGCSQPKWNGPLDCCCFCCCCCCSSFRCCCSFCSRVCSWWWWLWLWLWLLWFCFWKYMHASYMCVAYFAILTCIL